MKTRYSHESGSVRLVIFFLVLTAMALWEGGQHLYTALTNRHPTVLSYDAYVQSKPKAVWLMLTNCMLDLSQSCYKSYYGGKPTELFIPLRALERGTDRQIHVLLATADPAHLQTFAEMQALGSQTEAKEWLTKNSKRVFSLRNASGLVRFGISLDDKERRKLSNLVKNAADDFIIMQDGTQPSLASGLGFSLAGVMMLCGFVWYFRRNRGPSAAEAY